MTIKCFLFLGIVFLVVLLIVLLPCCYFLKRNFINEEESPRWIFLVAFIILGVCGIYTVKNYMYPKKSEVFENTDYHILEHLGFRSDTSIFLVNSDFPRKALWDDKSGLVEIRKDSIYIKEYTEPFLVSTQGKEEYFLANDSTHINIDSNGLLITRGNDTLYKLRIEQMIKRREEFERIKGKNDTITLYISEVNQVVDTSSFRKRINIGYPLADIVAKSHRIDISRDLQDLLEGVYLVREKIPIEKGNKFGKFSQSKNRNALTIVPGSNMYNKGIKINGKDIKQSEHVVPYRGETLLQSGIGKTKTDIYRLSHICDAKSKDSLIDLKYVLPKMQALRKGGGRFFLTSSVDNILTSSMDGGYYYNLFETKDNCNHINAEFKFTGGSATDSLQFTILDLYSDESNKTVLANNEFTLSTHPANNTKWVFKVHDLRAENDIQYEGIFWFICVFIFLVGSRIIVDYYCSEPKTLSVIELASYVVILTLCTVRLILAWRVTTFVPIEDITASVFAKMREGDTVFWCTAIIAWLFPIVMIILSLLKKFGREKQKKSVKTEDESVWKKLRKWGVVVFALFVLFIAICGILSWLMNVLPRFFNIPIPILLYFVTDFRLVHLQDSNGQDKKEIILPRIFRIVSAILIFFYLFLMDSGFSIIFLIFLIFFHAVVIGDLFLKNCKKSLLKFFIISLPCAVLLFFGLKFEGNLMDCVLDNSIVSEMANSKVYMKYRAEVQKLSEGEKIDNLIEKSDYNSADIKYIMRSAHNQWFINQYLAAGSKIGKTEGKCSYFVLQPHSNQGSSFPTQTTDLAVTRYVVAEHGEGVVREFMILFFFLVSIYCFEVNLKDNEKKTALGPLILLFVIALMVTLSATNRIVFIGQDFPFISIQSIVAIFFPVALIGMSVLAVYADKVNNQSGKDDEVKAKWLVFSLLIIFSVSSFILIKPQGANQNNDSFDISALIQNVSRKVESLDESFTRYQLDKKSDNWSKDSLWSSFVNSIEDYSNDYSKDTADTNVLLPEDTTDIFYKGLLKYFCSQQIFKNNPDELLHLRKRNDDLWHLSVNKKYYFINSDLKSTLQWKGNLLAAKSKCSFSLVDGKGKKTTLADVDSANILPYNIKKKVQLVRVAYFDKSWSDNNEPIMLISADQPKNRSEFFEIETVDGDNIEWESGNQIATLIKKGDLVIIQQEEKKQKKQVLTWQCNFDGDKYLAKNIWMNGKQRLFYPLGKESMWTYQFANVVSDVFGSSDIYRDSSLRISLDYDLHKKVYDIMSKKNTSKLKDSTTIFKLQKFKELSYSQMQDTNNKTSFYFDENLQKLYDNSNSKQKKDVIGTIAINKKDNKDEKKRKISEAIDKAIARSYDFTAVAIDGNGRIRLLFDHTKARNIDPNDIRYYNKFVSDLYKNENNVTERDILGNKALQIIPSGPGSSFKPILYTAVTTRDKLKWETLDVVNWCPSDALHVKKKDENKGNTKFDYYGGVKLDNPLSLEVPMKGYNHDDYLVFSNNVYHSVITLLGMQKRGKLNTIFNDHPENDKFSFPKFTYNGKTYCFDTIWYKSPEDFRAKMDNSVLTYSLFNNFRIPGEMADPNSPYTNYFGQDKKFKMLFDSTNVMKRAWTYAETGSQNTNARKLAPLIRNGFNQLFLGAYPLEVTPLQMAELTMRLATLNRHEHLTTLDDSKNTPPEDTFFEINENWGNDKNDKNDEYFKFYQRQVLTQLRNSTKYGTARGLKPLSDTLEKKGYYLYAKTGTLNDGRAEANSEDRRIKHLLVIIANKRLENSVSTTIDNLDSVKYYAVYLSFMGVRKEDFHVSEFQPVIEAIVESETFKEYMKK